MKHILHIAGAMLWLMGLLASIAMLSLIGAVIAGVLFFITSLFV
jgi:hypothetical protein